MLNSAIVKILTALLLGIIGFAGAPQATDLSEYKTADSLWQHIQTRQQDGPGEQARTGEEHRAILTRFLGELDTALAEFSRRFPADARSWDARLVRIEYAALLTNLQGLAYDRSADENTLKGIAAATNASVEAKTQAGFFLVQIHAEPLLNSTNAAALAGIETEIAAFEKQYPQGPLTDQLRVLQARLFQKSAPDKAESLWQVLAKSNDPQVAEQAQDSLVALQIARKPLQLKFTAIEGGTFDLEKLRGKVVLLDFWATWCGPCVMSVPGVVAMYGKLHDKGFEIAGISLDQDKDKLVAFTKQFRMTWPQYYDGKVWDNAISSRFRVHAIPATWLVDKKGYARPTEDGDLATQVEKLLSE